eukprot:GHVU01021818.1.p2 GENE.GHVU01021818.1~~GHVU01021818.1.p2  ORF type:complete len:133 (+),score=12.66 GHVU01021818.1:64-462(+)
MVSLSLRLCHNFAGPGKITIVPPTDPNDARIVSLTPAPIPEHVAPDSYAEAWSNTLQPALDGFVQDKYPQCCKLLGVKKMAVSLIVYMMAVDGTNINWYSLSKPDLKWKPTEKELKSKLEFLVTGAEGTWPG